MKKRLRRLWDEFREHFWFYLFIGTGTVLIYFALTVDTVFTDWSSARVAEKTYYRLASGAVIEEKDIPKFTKKKDNYSADQKLGSIFSS